MISLFFVGLILGLGGINCDTLQNTERSPSLLRNIDRFSNNLKTVYLNNERERNVEQNETMTNNYVMSPLSAFLPLFAVCRGAANTTEYQLNNILHSNCQDSKMRDDYVNLFSQFDEIKTASVKFTSGMFVSKKHQIKPDFKDNESQLLSLNDLRESMDFEQGEESANIINDWIKNRTNNLISDVVGKDNFNEDTVLVTVNTLYFKANWQNQFAVEKTGDEIFTDIEGNEQTVPFMRKENNYRTGFVSELESQFFELPFEGREFSFVIFLPNVGKSLSTLETKLGEFDMNRILRIENGLTKDVNRYSDDNVNRIELHLPKFNVTNSIKLKPLLRKMGLEDLIDKEGNLSKMIGDKLELTEAKQNVRIEVNEGGVSAAAATVFAFGIRSRPEPVKVDRPFTFVIRHHATGSNLFIGSIRSL